MGRFGINLPLLGGSRAAAGPSVPTEDANELSATVDGTTTTTQYTSETLETVNQDSATTVQTDTLQTTVSTTTTLLPAFNVDSTAPPNGVNTALAMGQHNSWWDYVGWSSAPPPSTTAQDKTEPEEQGAATPKPLPQSFPEVPEALPALPDSATSAPSADDDSKTLSPRTGPALSVSHEEQASWYYPWAWYGTTSSASAAASNVPPTESSEEKPVETQPSEAPEPATAPIDVPPPSSAESAATAAQQRYWTSFFTYSQPTRGQQSHANERTTVPTSESLPKDTTISPDSAASTRPEIARSPSSLSLGANPIGDSINSNRTGWVSFFSSSATLGYVSKKPITSGEPEVMEIDLDDGTDEGQTPQAAAAPVPPVAAKNETTDKSKKELNGKELKQSKEEEVPRPDGSVPTSKPAKSGPTKPAAPPLTISESVKRQVVNTNGTGSINSKRSGSPSPSVTSRISATSKAPSIAPPKTPTPNLVLPMWADTFHTAPRSVLPQRLLDANGKTVTRAVMEKTMKFVSGVLFAADSPGTTRSSSASSGKGKGRVREEREREKKYEEWGLGLPRSWDIVKPAAGKGHPEAGNAREGDVQDVLRGCKHVVVIGIHGWFPGAVMRSVLGEPTGTSTKFVNMMVSALEEFQAAYNVSLETVTCIPLEGEGTIEGRVGKLYSALTSNAEWMTALHAADVIFVATHSQGSIVSTHLLDRLIRDGHIRTGGSDVSKEPGSPGAAMPSVSSATLPPPPPQRVCCLALCGIHLGPLRYLSSSSLVLPYLQYFESAAAKELFEFQNTESEVSKAYVKALSNVVDNGTKMVYIASLNDQVVPIYSGLFTSASHPLILRALYIDGDAYHSSDFLSNLLVLLLRVLNAGLPESGLIAHLSEATAGSLNGVGHSTVYEELSTYSLAVKYLFLTNSGFDTHPKLVVEPFNANTEQNDYEIPWSLRDLIADESVVHFFREEISQLAAAFRHWHPKTTILRDIKRKLQPIQRLPPSFSATTDNTSPTSVSKL
ncbi:hypothetical protein C8F04DRAFT_76864 [Mycena alexandri]|uniref:YMC020W-like alpha/beta hydrolase domain-containing protein n=1 Tax=Mycena alexandri TaxID=1745969 RepID=A0AAD6TEE3_9AGAR|nr:hypothetical protein C8F04DRAFT_76864 [Mycena alexandri]